MKKTLRIFAVALLTMVSMGAWAKIDVQIKNDGKFDGGTIEVTGQKDLDDGVEVTITVAPNDGYTITKGDISVFSTISASGSRVYTRAPEIAETLTLYYNGSEKDDVKDPSAKRDYTFIVPKGFGAWVKEAKFTNDGSKGPNRNTPEEISDVNGLKSMTTSGNYIIKADINASDFTSIASFSGTLEADINPETKMPYRITGLSAPLFTTLTGTVKNLVLESVNISTNGKVGAVACTANSSARIYNVGVLSGSVGSTGTSSGKNSTDCCGGLVGELDGTARVINCYSYATITGGNRVGGIVGYNNAITNAGSIKTMIMNCMFYGDITGGNMLSPIYGGNNITNVRHDSDDNQDGLNTFNYYAYDKATTFKRYPDAQKLYNCALAVEEKYLNRFEFYRLLLNSNKKLAAIYATGSANDANLMLKWVLETADRQNTSPKPYPILKAQGKYPSIINPDFENAPYYTTVGRNKGGKLGTTLSVTISTNKSDGGQDWPEGANITTTSLTLQRTDKDFDRFNFNYDKVQLPYYNDVGTGNYTGNRVVTGWKITAITAIDGDPYTASDYPTTGITDFPKHNYADRKSSNKDLYTVSQRVFSQGAYFDVPYGVTSITIEPYWGVAAYIADEKYDVVYKKDYSGKRNVKQTGTQVGNGAKFNSQTIYKSISTDLLNTLTGFTVYDNAVVLVGNLHLDGVPSGGDKPFTMMSVDEDNDHEPDYSLIYHHKSRTNISPIRFDFLAIPGTAQAQKPNGASLICNFTIFRTRGWFEVTNTAFFYSSQLEYENGALGNDNSGQAITKIDAPLILHGGVIDQFVSTQSSSVNGKTIYIHVGSNVWMHEFSMGTHSDGSQSTPHVPVSVTGGDYESFYLTGTYNSNAKITDDNAECYISGGRFGEMAGAGQEQIGTTTKGNVHWQIYNADITNFFGGGINDAKSVKGNITTDIFNSYVDLFCGGPKFGNMASGKTVTTNADGCTFGKYFGAGYGGNSYSRKKYYDDSSYNWSTLQGYYTSDKGKYYNGSTTKSSQNDKKDYGYKGPGVATDFDYEFFVWSTGTTGARLFVHFVSFSLAQCNDVNSSLKNCTITEDFFGGGNLGKVTGKATSILEDCTVTGSVYGGGYSATLPTIPVRNAGFTTDPKFNSSSGMFESGVYSGTTEYTWKQVESFPAEGGAGFDGTHVITTQNLDYSNLGSVRTSSLTIKGSTTVEGSVYGGGALASMDANGETEVNLLGGTINGDVYGGGQGRLAGNTLTEVKAMVGSTHVNLNGLEKDAYVAATHSALVDPVKTDGTNIDYYSLKQAITGCVVKGSIFGCNNLNGSPKGSVTVNIYKTVGYEGHVRTGANAENNAAREAALNDPDDSHHSYEVKAVYGGGNLAAYEPNDANTKHTQVNIYGCGDTSIRQVYGGGNAASTPATQVDVYGTYEIEEVFGGGNGKDEISHDGGVHMIKNPGANVGFKDYWDYENGKDLEAYDTKEKRKAQAFIDGYVYGSGNANVNIHGGRTHRVFGGSNTRGNVRQTSVTMLEDAGGCDFCVDEAYGGGKSAPMDAEAKLLMACIPGLSAAYGGAEAADIQGDVTLNITNGTFDRVFGGNNKSGTINGSITVNIEETGCKPIIIGELYGGGNLAGYSVYGYDSHDNPIESGETPLFNHPQVNVKSFTSIGEVYGGGYGSTAVMVGNPEVNINVALGNWADNDRSVVADNATTTGGYPIPPHAKTQIGTINNVYGGGNAAKVIGNTTVNIGTLQEVELVTLDKVEGNYQKKTVVGADIRGNVYGGGNEAIVTGNTNVNIGKEGIATP